MKKLISLVAVVALAVTSLAGCGKQTADDGYTEVVMWSSDSHAKKAMEKLVKEFNETIGKKIK